MSENIEANVRQILARIENACRRSGRKVSEVKLVGVSKKQSIQNVQEYIHVCNLLKYPAVIGENYLQEFREKKGHLTGEFTSHFIGHLQTNKAKPAVQCFDLIQTVDSLKLANEISKHRSDLTKPYPVFIEINVSNDEHKFGFLINNSEIHDIMKHPGISVQGLMTITEQYEAVEDARDDFRKLANLAKTLQLQYNKPKFELSMGMSTDFEIAIEEGATMIRIGTVIFGARN